MSVKGGNLFAKVLEDRVAKLKSNAKLTVGFYADATEDDGTPVATVAYLNEFGEGVPARPFFRRMIAKESAQWGPKFARVLKQNQCDVNTGLQLMGEGIKSQLVKSIVDFKDPPNSAATVKAKGFDKPLIDTGTMERSVGYEVED